MTVGAVIGLKRDGETFYAVRVGGVCCGRHEYQTVYEQLISKKLAKSTWVGRPCHGTATDNEHWRFTFDDPVDPEFFDEIQRSTQLTQSRGS